MLAPRPRAERLIMINLSKQDFQHIIKVLEIYEETLDMKEESYYNMGMIKQGEELAEESNKNYRIRWNLEQMIKEMEE